MTNDQEPVVTSPSPTTDLENENALLKSQIEEAKKRKALEIENAQLREELQTYVK